MIRRTTLGLVLMLMLAACTAGDSASMSEATTAPADTTQMGGDDGAEGEQVSIATPETRKVIRRAGISIEAEDTRAVYAAIQRLVDEAQGFVESATVADPETGEDQPRIDVVIRIPADDLASTLDGIAALGTRVVSETQSGQDVTEEYVDIEARISNLTLLENELRALLEDVRQQPEADPAELLQVFNEISRVRGEIEQLEGRRQVLDDLTSLATVHVTVTPTPEVTPVVAEGWAPLAAARSALQDLVTALQVAGDLAITLALYVLPLTVLVLGLPVLVAWRLRRRFITPQESPTPEPIP